MDCTEPVGKRGRKRASVRTEAAETKRKAQGQVKSVLLSGAKETKSAEKVGRFSKCGIENRRKIRYNKRSQKKK